ncbi:hypothetical protein ACEZCY_13670 [Streptacidiphilus sp. N1-12]|uniref:Uncharacterized protein n=2 Tax=Streptacidiphilus alkalitolerans TaxID=3342712 RepID=A0ABV6V9A4_9ACTN
MFALTNGLARRGQLTEEQERFRRSSNDWFDANFANPADVDPTVYDHELNPGATAWFKMSARHLIERVEGYRQLLRAHGIVCVEARSLDPGRVIYEDEHQVVVVPTARPGRPG